MFFDLKKLNKIENTNVPFVKSLAMIKGEDKLKSKKNYFTILRTLATQRMQCQMQHW